jgi:hypothetical protein
LEEKASVGEKFQNLSEEIVERDPRWPIRVTMQFYKLSETMDDATMQKIFEQLAASRDQFVNNCK